MSRESELYKDKIEVSLDGRQIFYLFFGGAVIVGLVFVLGVMVGRRVEARGHVERAHVAATVDPLAALDRLEGGNGLSFQGTLRGADAPESDVEKKIDAMAHARGAEARTPAPAKRETASTSHADKVEPRDKGEKAETHDKVDTHAKVEKHDKAEPHDKADKASKSTSSTKAAEKTDKADKAEKSDKQADAKHETQAKVDAKDEHKADHKADDKSAKKSDKSRYTLQLSSFQDKHEAESFLASVKSSGFDPYITEADVDGKRYYRVRMGKYGSSDAANDAKAAFEKSLNKSASVMRL